MKKEMLRRGYSKETIRTYIGCVRIFMHKYKKDPRKYKKHDVKEFLDILVEKGMSAKTLNVYLQSLRFALKDILNKRVSLDIPSSKVPEKFPTVLTKEEVIRLFDNINNKKHLLMIKLLYSAGLRVSELVNLKVKDLELDKNFGWVRQGKGNKDRIFVLADNIKFELINHIKENNLHYESWLFSGYDGKHYSVRSIREIIKRASKRAMIKKNVHPHTKTFFCHTFNREWIRCWKCSRVTWAQ